MIHTTAQIKLARLAEVATRIPPETELDRFAYYVENGAAITSARWNVIEAENSESERTIRPEGGVTEEYYHRLGCSPWEKAELARAVLETLLRQRGHEAGPIEAAWRKINVETLPALVEEHSFETMADAVETLVKEVGEERQAVEGQAVAATSQTNIGSVEQIAAELGRRVEGGLGASPLPRWFNQ